MYLVKSCYEKDHILRRKTIKLGTLYEYREIESEQIVDPEEGIFRFRLSLDDEVEVPRAWANAMFSGAIGFGDEQPPPIFGEFSVHIDRIHMVRSTPESVIFAQCNAQIERHAPNCFIYCMSAVQELAEANGIFPDYDSSWAISQAKAGDIANAIGESLLRALWDLEQAGKSALPEGISVQDVEIGCRHELVNYVPREQHIRVHGAVSVDDFMQSIRDMSFVKPPSYMHELEYRFSYTLGHDDGFIVYPKVKNIILPAGELIDLLVSA